MTYLAIILLLCLATPLRVKHPNRGRGSGEVKKEDLMRRKEEVGLRCWWCAASVEIGANRRACNR